MDRAIFEKNIEYEIQKACTQDLTKICEHCGGTIGELGFCDDCCNCNQENVPMLSERLFNLCNNFWDKYSLYTKLHNVFNKGSYLSEQSARNPNYRRIYFFSNATNTGIELRYRDVEKGINIMGRMKFDSLEGTVRFSEKQFREVYIYILKKKGLCLNCGNSFKGIINKVCGTCGKPKNY